MSSLRDCRIDSRPNRKPPHDQGSRRAVLAERRVRTGTPFVVSRMSGCPAIEPQQRIRDEHAVRPLAPSSPSTRPVRASARNSEVSTSVRSSIRLAALRATLTRDASDRRLPSHVSVRVPAPRWFSMIVTGLRPCVTEGLSASRAAQFALASRRNGRASDISVASPPLTAALARDENDGSRRDRMRRAA